MLHSVHINYNRGDILSHPHASDIASIEGDGPSDIVRDIGMFITSWAASWGILVIPQMPHFHGCRGGEMWHVYSTGRAAGTTTLVAQKYHAYERY